MILALDIGGTSVKMGLADEQGVLHERAEADVSFDGYQTPVIDTVVQSAVEFLARHNASVCGAGISATGQIDGRSGVVIGTNGKIPHYEGTPIKEKLERALGVPVWALNDANAAALGEVVAGCAQNVDSAVILTLGTGVGSGVVLNGKILTGCTGGAAELGHMVVEDGGAPCACGRKGCFEAYASATGLIRMAKEAMAQHPESLLHATAAEVGEVNGRTIFQAKEQGDPTAAAVVDRYIHYLSVGIANIINCFYPEVVALSGGIANQGEALLAPLREAVAPQVYGNQYLQTHTRILGCTLGYHAGIIGAAMLPPAL